MARRNAPGGGAIIKTHIAFFTLLILSSLTTPRTGAQPKWVQIDLGTSRHLRSVSFTDSSNGIIVGDDWYLGEDGSFFRTGDGGYSWAAGTFAYVSRMHDVVHGTSGVVFANGLGPCLDVECGAMFRSVDSGVTWSEVPDGLSAAYTEAIAFAPPSQVVAAGGSYTGWTGETWGTFMRSADTGATWSGLLPLDQESYAVIMDRFTDIALPDTSFCAAICEAGRVLRHVGDSVGAQGRSFWDTLVVLPSGLRAVSFIDTVHGTVVGDTGKIWRTTDGGATWLPQTGGTSAALLSVQFLSETEGYIAGEGGTILHTTDGGANWAAAPGIPNVSLNKIFFTDPDHGWAVGDGGTVLSYGEIPLCTVSPAEIDYGNVLIGAGKSDSVLVSNPGSDTLAVALSASHPDFTFDAALELAPGDSSWVVVAFNPSAIGEVGASLVLQHNAPSSPDTIPLRGNALELDSTTIDLGGWSLVSLPRVAPNDSVAALFPNAISPAYRFDPGSGYVTVPTLEPGVGYWIKAADDTVTISGYTIPADTIEVMNGWNLIGTISSPMSTAGVAAVGGSIASGFFGYGPAGYFIAHTLQPGRGYWVKVNGSGYLVLQAP